MCRVAPVKQRLNTKTYFSDDRVVVKEKTLTNAWNSAIAGIEIPPGTHSSCHGAL